VTLPLGHARVLDADGDWFRTDPPPGWDYSREYDPPTSADGLRALIRARLGVGGPRQLSPLRWRWEAAGRCEAPITFERYAQPAYRRAGYASSEGAPVILEMQVPCRRCQSCLRARARRWRQAAEVETRAAARTWLVTLTLSPGSRYLLLCRSPGSSADRWAALVGEAGKEITKWLKRLRKESGASLRYMCVAEEHGDGDPHWHLLLHEVSGVVKKRSIQSQWLLGYSSAKLVDTSSDRAAGYPCKYLSKSIAARVRASIRYGETFSNIANIGNDKA
jgi:hypothetical protein